MLTSATTAAEPERNGSADASDCTCRPRAGREPQHLAGQVERDDVVERVAGSRRSRCRCPIRPRRTIRGGTVRRRASASRIAFVPLGPVALAPSRRHRVEERRDLCACVRASMHRARSRSRASGPASGRATVSQIRPTRPFGHDPGQLGEVHDRKRTPIGRALRLAAALMAKSGARPHLCDSDGKRRCCRAPAVTLPTPPGCVADAADASPSVGASTITRTSGSVPDARTTTRPRSPSSASTARDRVADRRRARGRPDRASRTFTSTCGSRVMLAASADSGTPLAGDEVGDDAAR